MGFLPDNHVYSYSQLSSFAECPFSFYLERIEQVDKVSNAFAEQGTLIHELIDEWAQGLLAKEDMPGEYKIRWLDTVVTAFPRVLASKGYTEKAYQQGLDYLINFDEFEGFEILDAESRFKTTIAGRPFVGVVDMVARETATGALYVIDHKSKSLSSFKKSEREMYKQQYLYAKYIYEKYGCYPDMLAFNLFKEGGLMMRQPFSMEIYEQTLSWAADIMEKIETFDAVDWLQSKGKSDFFCQNLCAVRRSCPFGAG